MHKLDEDVAQILPEEEEERLTNLIIDVKPSDVLNITGKAMIEVLHKSGKAARLRITAANTVKIERIIAAVESKRIAI